MGNRKDLSTSESIGPFQVKRERVIRQNRLDLVGDHATLVISGQPYEIFDCSPFGLALITPTPLSNESDTLKGSVVYQNRLVNEIKIRPLRHEPLSNGTFKSACEVVGEPIDIDKMNAIKTANNIIKQNNLLSDQAKNVPEEFKKLVYEMRDWLETLKKNVNSIESKFEYNKSKEISDFENTVANIVGDYIVLNFEPLYKHLEDVLKNKENEQINAAFSFFRGKMQELLIEAPFHNRAYSKPLGYAGDFQMMNQIYAYESLGTNLFAKCLHSYFISAPESRAVRNRALYLEQQFYDLSKQNEKQVIRVLSVASGPAMEVQQFIKNHPELNNRFEFHLLDQDEESLQHAQRMIGNVAREKNIQVNCKFHNKTIKHIIAAGFKEKDFDLIYSAGLFDYFSDPVAQVAAQRIYDSLRSGGKFIIGNFSTSSPGRLTMDMALDWKLIYRSPEDLISLFGHVGNNFKLEKEPEGINLFFHIFKE